MAKLPLWLDTNTGAVIGANSRPKGFVKVVYVTIVNRLIESTIEGLKQAILTSPKNVVSLNDISSSDTSLTLYSPADVNVWWVKQLKGFPYIKTTLDADTILTISYFPTQTDAKGKQATTGKAEDNDSTLPAGQGRGGGGGNGGDDYGGGGDGEGAPTEEVEEGEEGEGEGESSEEGEGNDPYEKGQENASKLPQDKKDKMKELMDKDKGDVGGEPTTDGEGEGNGDGQGEGEGEGDQDGEGSNGDEGEGGQEGEQGEGTNGNGEQGQGQGEGEGEGDQDGEEGEQGDGDQEDEGLDPLEQAVEDAKDAAQEAKDAAQEANADEAQEAADKAQEAADLANEIAEQVGDGEAEEMADKAQEYADEAQESADDAKELEEMIREMFEDEEDLEEEDYEEFKEGVLDEINKGEDEEDPDTPEDLDKSEGKGVYVSNYGSHQRDSRRYVNWETGEIQYFGKGDKLGPNWIEVTKFFSGVYDGGNEIVVDRTIEGAIILVNKMGGNVKNITHTSFSVVNGDAQITDLLNKMRMFIVSGNEVSY